MYEGAAQNLPMPGMPAMMEATTCAAVHQLPSASGGYVHFPNHTRALL